MPNVIVNDLDMYYEVHGKGMALLLVAGLASDSQSWLPVVKQLSKFYKVVIFDNRGTGRTKPMDVETSIQKMSDDCMMLIRHLKLKAVNILGHSMGGFIALDCAIRYPEYISKLILVCTSAHISRRNASLFSDWHLCLKKNMEAELWFRNLFYWIFSEEFFEDEDFLLNAVNMAIQYPYPQSVTAFGNQIHAINQFNCITDLEKITSDTLIISAGKDLIFPISSIEILKRIPRAVFSVIQKAPHSIHTEKAQEFLVIVQKFLSHS